MAGQDVGGRVEVIGADVGKKLFEHDEGAAYEDWVGPVDAAQVLPPASTHVARDHRQLAAGGRR